jgi:hypothetical protein
VRSAVVFESWYGNTHKVAEAIAGGLATAGEVVLRSVDDPPPAFDELDLVVVGAPTHIHGLSSGVSRKSAVEQGHLPRSTGIGARGWLHELPSVHGTRAAAFDTRIEKPVMLVGSAARGIAKRLRRRGFELVAPPESFFVLDGEGPLGDGELERARAWGERLAAAVRARSIAHAGV